ncbi:MAG: hypothetical protein RLZZ471_444 [Actinomycetota bacterium]|jgi:hypothetical protein
MALYDLKTIPAGAQMSKVVAEVRELDGRDCLWVALPADIREVGLPDVDYIDTENFVILPVDFSTGTLEVDIYTTLAHDATPDDRGFSGLAYHIDEDIKNFESVYIRGTNGLKENPPAPRNARAIQYFAFPDAKFDYLRENFPDVYEAPANLGLNEWLTLKLEVTENGVIAYVNGESALVVDGTLCKSRSGGVGLRVDIGTEAYFSNLKISA